MVMKPLSRRGIRLLDYGARQCVSGAWQFTNIRSARISTADKILNNGLSNSVAHTEDVCDMNTKERLFAQLMDVRV